MTTATYLVLLYGDESAWAARTPAQVTELDARHVAFTAACTEHGHTVVGGNELAYSRSSRSVRRTPTGPSVTDGPYAETAEQLGGWYLIESADVDHLVGLVAEHLEEGAEIRPVGSHD